MENSWETYDCSELEALYDIYTIYGAAALWCGVPKYEVEDIVQESKLFTTPGSETCIWIHPRIRCLEFRSRAISIAVGDHTLRCVNVDGKPVDRCADLPPEYRYILGRDLKDWMEKEFPDERPAFLFTDAERNSYAIKTKVYRKLKKERDDLEIQLKDMTEFINALKEDKKTIKAKLDTLKAEIDKAGIPSERSEITYQNIIAALLRCMAGEVQGTIPHPSFVNKSNKFVKAKLVTATLDAFPDIDGLSLKTFERKFLQTKDLFRSY